MKICRILFFLALSVNTTIIQAGGSNCFPKTDVQIPVNNFFETNAGLTEAEFNSITARFQNFWNPILLLKYQKQLFIENKWSASRVNALATRDDNDNLIIKVNGGLARHPEITKNGLLMILCHELGHYLGGAPKSFRGKSKKRSWSSAEGQADYFATAKCMPKLISNNEFYSDKMLDSDGLCPNEICKKILPAALAVGNLFASLKGEWKKPSADSKSKFKVRSTNYQHPNPQCRLDTFIAGSLCSQELEIDFDNQDHKIGSCLEDSEPEASRPSCWFATSKY